jgi:hypothetical protein
MDWFHFFSEREKIFLPGLHSKPELPPGPGRQKTHYTPCLQKIVTPPRRRGTRHKAIPRTWFRLRGNDRRARE